MGFWRVGLGVGRVAEYKVKALKLTGRCWACPFQSVSLRFLSIHFGFDRPIFVLICKISDCFSGYILLWIKLRVYGWSDLGRKENERKEIGKKGIYFHCLIGRKSWKGKDEQCQNSMGPIWTVAIFFPSASGRKPWGRGEFLFPPPCPSCFKRTVSLERDENEMMRRVLGCTKPLKVLCDPSPLFFLFKITLLKILFK